MTSSPIFSIVIPLKNEAENLRGCVRSLLAQRCTANFEILLVDNGSTDKTPEIAAELARSDLRIHFFREKRPGAPCARNTGAKKSKGKILVFTDADCVFPACWLESISLPLRKKPLNHELPMAVASGDSDAWKRPGARLNFWERYSNQLWREWERDRFSEFPGFLPWAPTCNFAVNADLFRALGGFDENLTAGYDIDFCWRLVLNGFMIAHSPGAIVSHRRRNSLKSVLRQVKVYAFFNRSILLHYEKIYGLDAALSTKERLELLAGQARAALVRSLSLEEIRYRLVDLIVQGASASAAFKAKRSPAQPTAALTLSRLGKSPARRLLPKSYYRLQSQGWCYWISSEDEGALILFKPREKQWLKWNSTAWEFWKLESKRVPLLKSIAALAQGADPRRVRQDLLSLRSELREQGFLL